ncbi:LTA synthase family protein [Enterococcus sp. LJL90]
MTQKIKNIFGKLRLPTFLNTRLGLFFTLLILLWAKTIFAYFVEFNLGVENLMQYVILFINPIASSLLILGLALYIRSKKLSYITMMTIYSLLVLLLFSNAVYYREFTDFITINTMLGAGKVASGLGESALRLFRPYDIIYILDIPLFILALVTKKIKMQEKPVKARYSLAFSAIAVLVFTGNLNLAESERPGLLTRTFSREYLVKFLGINAFTVYDGVQTYQTNQIKAEASENDLLAVENYVDEHYAAPDESMFGIAEGRNVIYVHLESFQQFLIDYSLVDEEGVAHEVTPFLNSLYTDQSTYSFDNFFHQVNAGKTSDAETLMENSLFGLSQGSLFTQSGSTNTFQAAPDILSQTAGYTSAVFHGNSGNFWNRNETYKSFGYDYFFDENYYDVTDDNSFQYGLHDKPFFEQSAQYLEQLQQPFYTKFLAVSNHYPYSDISSEESGFPRATTDDETINGYFATANYLDTAVEEFFNYLKASGLYDNSIIILYGDHYGISNSRNQDLAELVGETSSSWNNFDNAQMQRVPYMIHIPGETGGYVNHTYSGQVDALPTLMHLLGIDTSNYLMLGQDLFSPEREELVAFRNGSFITPEYTSYNGLTYYNENGRIVTSAQTAIQDQLEILQNKVNLQLSISDQINNGDLLRFYSDSGLTPINTDDYSYLRQVQQMQDITAELGDASTSLLSVNGGQSTSELYDSKTYQDYHPVEVAEEATDSSQVEEAEEPVTE